MEEKQRRSLFPEEWRRVQTCGMNSEVKEWNCSRFKGKELQWDHRGGVMERDSGGIWSKFIKYLWLWAQSWAREEEPDFLKTNRVIEWRWWSLDEWSCKKTDWNFHFTLHSWNLADILLLSHSCLTSTLFLLHSSSAFLLLLFQCVKVSMCWGWRLSVSLSAFLLCRLWVPVKRYEAAEWQETVRWWL